MMLLVFNIILFLSFYIKLASLKLNCSISTKPWQAGQSQTVFFILTCLSLCGSTFYFFYIFQKANISGNCGPFQDLMDDSSVIGSVVDGDILVYVLKPGLAGCILAALM